MVRALLFVIVSVLVSVASAEPDRVAQARKNIGKKITAKCESLGVVYPPKSILLRAFKAEKTLEVWIGPTAEGKLVLLASYPIAAASGVLGPKRNEGDRQVPEGIYEIDTFNPTSKFHLSMRVSYPNASDRIRSDAVKPGGDIYIHGNRKSIGCLAMTDPVIEELYILCLDFAKHGKRVKVHIFPARMTDAWMKDLTNDEPEITKLWRELAPIYRAFERTRVIPKVSVDKNGAYKLIANGS
jgi:murein L,D-transpeptidase YafK